MKIEFVYGGDVHPFVMAMMQGQAFTLKGSGKDLTVKPNLKQGGFSIKSGTVSSEMVMTIPVTLPDFGGEALMTFQYSVVTARVAPAVAPVEEVVGIDAIAGVSCPVGSMPEQVEDGVKFWGSERFPKPDVKMVAQEGDQHGYSVMVGAKLFKSVAPRPAIEGRPAVEVTVFQRSSRECRIKFE